MARFDEIELQPAVLELSDVDAAPGISSTVTPAPRFKRLLALVTDLSLFVALSLALSPLLPASMSWPAVAALAGFVVVVSFYYYVGSWLLWGKTIGGAIFDLKIISIGTPAMPLKNAAQRWAGLYLSLLTAGA